ncbi:peptidoglycan D,D-transpeptidase FtsI family protein [Candidatus Frankia alpina]|uniref:peptidoglycan D,D-transpeptidase FtsI family protein n=1 Tax=Candidatus Frankia alpina TaxID=2699483 RepID=UPI0013D3C018|nr:penicillin-binding protein 2 [Candidatus Frankia alpina]
MSSTPPGSSRRGRDRLRLVTPPPASVRGGRRRRDDDADHGQVNDWDYDDPGRPRGRPGQRADRARGAQEHPRARRGDPTRSGTTRSGTAQGRGRARTARGYEGRYQDRDDLDDYDYDYDGVDDVDGAVAQGRRVYRPGGASRGSGAGRGRAARGGGRAGGGRRPPRPPVRRNYRLGSPRRRLRVTIVFMCVLLGVLALRLTQLQGFSASTYAAQAEAERLRTIVLPAVRGAITDRSGHTLAQHVELRAVYANPTNVKDIGATARKLAPVLDDSIAELTRRLTDPTRHIKFVYLARRLTPDIAKKVSALQLRGIGITEERGRTYPAGPLAANVVGFMRYGDGDVLEGGGGLELKYDKVLRGTDGKRRLEANPEGIEIPSGQSRQLDPVPGSALRLTLDRDIQWNAQQAIADAVRSSEADGGTVVVMDPRTGDILAMADAPQFDPNNITPRDQSALGNRSTRDAYEPGSVNKVITMAAALDRGLITSETPLTIPPSIVRGGVRIEDSEKHGVEHLTTAGVLARSSNIGTVEVSERVGRPAMEQALRAFGLGAKTGLHFPGEGTGLLPTAKDWSGSQAATISYGQGMSATALQMASVYATVANGGVRVTPRLVDAVTGPDGTVQVTPHLPGQRVISAQTASTLSRMLEAVATNEGTAPLAEISGYRVAGKTGTASRPDPVHGGYQGYVSSFIGFAPADDPKVVVEVVLDDPKKGYFGGQVAAPVFQGVMSFALTTLGVPQPTTKPSPLLLDLDK